MYSSHADMSLFPSPSPAGIEMARQVTWEWLEM